AQTRLFWIPPNVAHTVRKMSLVANETIEVIALPKISRAIKKLVDLPGREALPTLGQLLQGPFWILDEQRMSVIRHYGERNHDDTLAFEMPQRFCHDLRTVLPSKKARTMARIEPAFDSPGKALMI